MPTYSTITTPDGHELAVYVWDAHAARGVVQIAHGLSEHALRYDWVARKLNAAGYAVFAHDHRGHGRSAQGKLGYFADAAGWSKVVEDVGLVGARARDEYPDVPLVLLGHSMGSFISRAYAIAHSELIDGLVIVGTGSDAGALARAGEALAAIQKLLVGAKRPAKLLNRLSFGGFNKQFKPNRTEFDWLSRDAAQVDAYVADPLCGAVPSVGLFADLLGGMKMVNTEAEVAKVRKDLPIYIFSGMVDPVGENGRGVQAVRDQLERQGVGDLTLKLYPEARHEVLNETNRDEVVSDLVHWLQARF